MKYPGIIILLLANLWSVKLSGQVKWQFSSQQKADDLFEIHLTAKIEKDWHLYSQLQPPESIADPAAIVFEKSPSIQLLGNVKEIGHRETYENKTLGIKSFQYRSQVDFIQLVKLHKTKKVSLNGTISFMLCNDQECIPTTTQKFSVPIL